MPTQGGLASTLVIALASFASGALFDALHAVNQATAGITSGQAALVVGFTGLLFQYGPRAVKWLAQSRAVCWATERVSAWRAKKG